MPSWPRHHKKRLPPAGGAMRQALQRCDAKPGSITASGQSNVPIDYCGYFRSALRSCRSAKNRSGFWLISF
jgi:hypothetical protein